MGNRRETCVDKNRQCSVVKLTRLVVSLLSDTFLVLTEQRTEVISIGKYLHQTPSRRVKSLFTQGNKRLQTND